MQISPKEEELTKKIWDLLKNENIVSKRALEKYNNLLIKYEQLLKLISLDNSISYLYNTSDLIKSGMFSYLKFISDDPKFIEYHAHNGIHVVIGEGVCRNVASFTTDLMKNTSYFCENFFCYFTKDKIEYDDKMKANHVCNLIKYNNIYYVYDVYNNEIFYFNNQYMLSTFENNNYLYYCPLSELELSDMSSLEINKRIITFQETATKEKINYNEIEQILEETRLKRFNHLCDINDFFYDTFEEKKELDKEIKKYKKIK